MNQTAELKDYKTDEKKFYAWLRDGLSNMSNMHIQRIENTTSPGVPDINVANMNAADKAMGLTTGNIEVWIELKMVLPEGIVIRKEQYAWGIKRSMCGGNVFILAYDIEKETIRIHMFPHIIVKPRGTQEKYVTIVSNPFLIHDKKYGIVLLWVAIKDAIKYFK